MYKNKALDSAFLVVGALCTFLNFSGGFGMKQTPINTELAQKKVWCVMEEVRGDVRSILAMTAHGAALRMTKSGQSGYGVMKILAEELTYEEALTVQQMLRNTEQALRDGVQRTRIVFSAEELVAAFSTPPTQAQYDQAYYAAKHLLNTPEKDSEQ